MTDYLVVIGQILLAILATLVAICILALPLALASYFHDGRWAGFVYGGAMVLLCGALIVSDIRDEVRRRRWERQLRHTILRQDERDDA